MMQRRYFPDQSLSPETELRPDELQLRAAYVAAVCEADKPNRLEIVIEGQIQRVIYFGDRNLSDLFEEHQKEYPGSGMAIKKPERPEGEYAVEEELQYSVKGELLGSTCSYQKNEITVFIDYRDGAGKLFRKDVFDYVGDEISQVRVLDGNGELLHVQVY
jgi:hypothetical protein